MADRLLFPRGRHSVVLVFSLTVALSATVVVSAETDPATERAVAELNKRVDALQKDVALAGARTDVDALKKELETVKQGLQQRSPAAPAPPVAWLALMIVGSLLVVFWARVNNLRESTRRDEAILKAVVELRAKGPQDKFNQDFENQIRQLQNLLSPRVNK